MRVLPLLVVMLAGPGCGRDPDFEPPPRDDMLTTRDLSSSLVGDEPDLTCPNLACGGCSSFANWDGTPAKVGDPCLWKGAWQCSGTQLECSDNGCPTCGVAMTGSVCGADGHTVLELTNPGSGCRVYDFGSVISVCNRTPGDHCVGRCSAGGGGRQCVAHCISDDAGGTGCEHQPSDTCDSLMSC